MRDIVSWWRFENNGDDETGLYPGTNTSGATYVSNGKNDYGIEFHDKNQEEFTLSNTITLNFLILSCLTI